MKFYTSTGVVVDFSVKAKPKEPRTFLDVDVHKFLTPARSSLSPQSLLLREYMEYSDNESEDFECKFPEIPESFKIQVVRTDYERHDTVELRNIAKNIGIHNYRKLNRQELLEVLTPQQK
jgi:hypothetical protein